ncbi:MAG: glycoside hydrolase family 97 N-terminal domain-containing protein, partial [Gemmatimonadaceae bacterium]|nr:glycoside hydrolase family 97 N-terminal domain-containing protein [Gemmatimonadaceae bacterium]
MTVRHRCARALRGLARRTSIWVALAAVMAPTIAATQGTATTGALRLASPDGRNEVTVLVREGGLYYAVSRKGRPIVTPSRLGFTFRGAPPLKDGLR